MQFGKVDSQVGHFKKVLDFFTVRIFDRDLRIKSSEDNLLMIKDKTKICF